MHIKWKPLLLALAIPLAVGGLASFLTRRDMEAFSQLNQPPLSPPSWLFPVVWTILYLLMGLASYLVWEKDRYDLGVRRALTTYGIQLAVNFFWSLLFFHWKLYLVSFLWLVMLWGLILLTMVRFGAIRRSACWLLLPYVLWVTFAGYLNLGIYFLN